MLYPTHLSYHGTTLILLNFVSSYLIQLVALINLFLVNSTDAAKNSLRREVEILKSKPHWSKAYFYLWDEVRYFTFSAMSWFLGKPMQMHGVGRNLFQLWLWFPMSTLLAIEDMELLLWVLLLVLLCASSGHAPATESWIFTQLVVSLLVPYRLSVPSMTCLTQSWN